MAWLIEYTHEAQNDLDGLDHSQRILVFKAIRKVSGNPLPASEGGYGKSLGNRKSSHLSGYFKIKIKSIGIRVVYGLVRSGKIMRVIVVSVRSDDTVYKIAQKRINK
jgi:mRNA interferase RelE/StbE